jgi:uncharacterized protein YndB with AHSA1/START domain
MTTQEMAAPVRTTIVVDAPLERAFEVFTTDMGSWWPADKHILGEPVAEIVFEPQGGIVDRGVNGAECRWARVLAYEPPHRVVFSWDINLGWQLETDPSRTSEVEVRFTAQDGGRTLVELEHRHLDRHGDGWEQMRAAVGSPNGWADGMRAFAAYLAR